jgi:hypothetical protein
MEATTSLEAGLANAETVTPPDARKNRSSRYVLRCLVWCESADLSTDDRELMVHHSLTLSAVGAGSAV